MNNLEAIIFKVQDYGETSRLLQTFTRRGKVNLIAKGSQKLNSELRIMSQYLTHISFNYSNFKTLLPLYNGKIINDFADIKSSYQKTKEASLLLEIISNVILDEKYNERVFNNLVLSLNHDNIALASLSFAMKMVYYLGYGLDLIGNGNNYIGFNLNKGEVVYENENLPLNLNLEETISLYELTYSKIDELKEIDERLLLKFKNFVFKLYLEKTEIKLNALI